jgi:hypothetical protein
MVKRTITILLILAVLGIIAYDTWKYVSAQQRLRDATYELTRWAGENADTMSRDQAAAQLAAMGSERGVTVYQYGQSDQGVQVWTETTVDDTVVAGTVANLVAGTPLSEAVGAPFVIRDYREAGVQ